MLSSRAMVNSLSARCWCPQCWFLILEAIAFMKGSLACNLRFTVEYFSHRNYRVYGANITRGQTDALTDALETCVNSGIIAFFCLTSCLIFIHWPAWFRWQTNVSQLLNDEGTFAELYKKFCPLSMSTIQACSQLNIGLVSSAVQSIIILSDF